MQVFGDAQASVVRDAKETIGGGTHTHTLSNTLIGSLFHTACQFGLCNPQYPERLRSSGCWQRTLDDTLSLSGGAPDCAENM